MKSEEFFAAIGEIDGKFVEATLTAPKVGPKKRVIIGFGALAACVALAVSAAYLYDRNEPEVLHHGKADGEQYGSMLTDPEPCIELSIENAYKYEDLGGLLPKKWLDGRALSECFPEAEALVFERRQDIPGSRTVMQLILDSSESRPAITLIISDEGYFEESMSADGLEYNKVYRRGNGSRIYVESGGYVAEYFTESGDLSELGGLFDMINSAECFAEAPESSRPVSLNDVASLDAVGAFISLSGEDYAAFTYDELTEYFGFAPSADALPYLARAEGNYGVYRTDGRGIYYDCNAVCFESADGARRLKVDLSKAFKQGGSVFDLVSDGLAFTDINGRNIAIFRCNDEAGQSRLHAEFLRDEVAVCVDSENIPYEDFVICLKELIGEQEQSAGGENAVSGTVTAVDPNANRLGIAVESGGEKLSYGIFLPDGISAEDYKIGDGVTATFKGEPATVLTVWKEQLISVEPKKD